MLIEFSGLFSCLIIKVLVLRFALSQSARLCYHLKKSLSTTFLMIFHFFQNASIPLKSRLLFFLYRQLCLFSKHLVHFYKLLNYQIFSAFRCFLQLCSLLSFQSLFFFSYLMLFCWTFVGYLVYFTLYNAFVNLKCL